MNDNENEKTVRMHHTAGDMTPFAPVSLGAAATAGPPASPMAGGEDGTGWVCPHCGFAALRVAYSEHRSCRVTSSPDRGSGAPPLPWPSYEDDEFVDSDPESFVFSCEACLADEVVPCRAGRLPASPHP